MTLAAGNDTVEIGAVSFTGSTLLAGDGSDSIVLGGATAASAKGADAEIFLGAGNDTLTIAGAVDATDITSASGDNLIKFAGANATTELNVTLGSGADTVQLGDQTGDAFAKTTVKLGEGNDSLRLDEDLSGAAGAHTLYGGAGTDTITFNDNNAVSDGVHECLGFETAYVKTGGNATVTLGESQRNWHHQSCCGRWR